MPAQPLQIKTLFAQLLASYGPFMLAWEAPYSPQHKPGKAQGKLYLLWQHHRHLEPMRDAPRVYLGRYKLPSLKPRAERHKTDGNSTYYYYVHTV